MVKVCVTGADGFIGSRLVRDLLENGHEVVGIDNFANKNNWPKNIDLYVRPDYSFHYCDIRNSDLLNDILRKTQPNVIVHLAALTGVRDSETSDSSYYSVNIDGTNTLLKACRSQLNKVKIIIASTSSVYGTRFDSVGEMSESDNLRPTTSPYAISKVMVENLAYRHHHTVENQPVLVLRLFTVYGPKGRKDMFMHKLADALKDNSELFVHKDATHGMCCRDFTYIEDVVHHGISVAISVDIPTFEIINIASGVRTSLYKVIEIMQKLAIRDGYKSLKFTEQIKATGEMWETHANIGKAYKLLGYTPTTTIAQGIEAFWDQHQK